MMSDWERNLKERTKRFALQIIRMYCSLPKTSVAQVLGKQLLKSGTSPGAHYREALRARSKAEFISKLGGGLQELEETEYWLELLVESNIVGKDKINPLLAEASELIAMFTASIKTAKEKRENK
jgi:four helix bundle protein